MVTKEKSAEVLKAISNVRTIGERYWHNGINMAKAHLREENGRLLNNLQRIFVLDGSSLAIVQPYMQGFMIAKRVRRGIFLPTYQVVALNADTDPAFCDQVLEATGWFFMPIIRMPID